MSKALQYFKALSDDTRLRLVLLLNRYELNVNELVEILSMGQSRVSRHLKILSEAGLLNSRRDGLWVFYSTPTAGDGHDFISVNLPFMAETPTARDDLSLAAGIIEERAGKTNQFFNLIAEDWDRMSKELLGSFKLEDIVLAAMPKCEVAVDLGCGTGGMLNKLLTRAERVIGVDGSARMLELARRRFVGQEERVSLRIGDLTHLPLRDAEADFVCINLVLHHLFSPLSVLQEVTRVLKPGSMLFLSEFDQHDDESLREDYGDRWLGFTDQNLRTLLEQSNLRVITAKSQKLDRGLTLYLFTARKPA